MILSHQLSKKYDESQRTSTANTKSAMQGRVCFYPFQLNDIVGVYCSNCYLNLNYSTENNIDNLDYESAHKFNESQFFVGWQYESFWLYNICADFHLEIGLRNYQTTL